MGIFALRIGLGNMLDKSFLNWRKAPIAMKKMNTGNRSSNEQNGELLLKSNQSTMLIKNKEPLLQCNPNSSVFNKRRRYLYSTKSSKKQYDFFRSILTYLKGFSEMKSWKIKVFDIDPRLNKLVILLSWR